MSTEVEIGRSKRALRAYSFDDIAVVPSRRTRDPKEVSIAWQIDAYHFELPFIGAPMDSAMSPDTAIALGKLGGLGVLAGPVRAGHREAQHDPRDARDDLDVLGREHVRGLDGGLGQVHDLFGPVAGQEVADLQAGAVGGHGPRVGVDAAAVTTSLVARAGPPFRPRRTRALPCPDPLVGWGA